MTHQQTPIESRGLTHEQSVRLLKAMGWACEPTRRVTVKGSYSIYSGERFRGGAQCEELAWRDAVRIARMDISFCFSEIHKWLGSQSNFCGMTLTEIRESSGTKEWQCELRIYPGENAFAKHSDDPAEAIKLAILSYIDSREEQG